MSAWVTYIVPPNKMWSLFGTVTATVDADHAKEWAVDGRPGFPIRFNSTTASMTIAASSGTVDFVGLFHHNLRAGVTGTFSGGVSKVVTTLAVPNNGVPYNAFGIVSPQATGVTSVNLAIATNDTDIIIGEIILGQLVQLNPPLRIMGNQFGERQYIGAEDNPLSGVPPYSDRSRSRMVSGSQLYSASMLSTILGWFDAQDGNAYPIPSVLVLDSTNTQSAQLVYLAPPTYSIIAGSDLYQVNLSFTEIPRQRW